MNLMTMDQEQGNQANGQGAKGPVHAPSSPLADALKLIKRVARTDCNVLITGESGTGKEVVVRALHQWSNRSRGPFVPVNCGAIPENLLESELFGHVKGAFTGADRPRTGRFEMAQKGTIFLDEVGELPQHLQVKLLRVIQERVVQPLGGQDVRQVNFRLVAATNVSLEDSVREQQFREDLYFRLNVMRVHLPALRERPMDIPPLMNYFMTMYNDRLLTEVTGFDDGAIQLMQSRPWPGNVRELENFIQGVMVLKGDGVVTQRDVYERLQEQDRIGSVERPHLAAGPLSAPAALPMEFPEDGIDLVARLDEYETRLIQQALEMANGNKSKAARLLGVNRTTLVEKLKRKGIVLADG